MELLQTLCLVKMDSVDGRKPADAAGKQDQVKTKAADSKNSHGRPNSSAGDKDGRTGTEMKGELRRGRVKDFYSYRMNS